MNKIQMQVLLVEDTPTDDILLREALRDDTLTSFNLTTVERLSEALARLTQTPFEVILLDLGLPDSQGLETFTRLHQIWPDLPVVVLSGQTDDGFALQAVQAGAQDYLVKSPTGFSAVARAVRYAVERHQAQKKLRASEERYRNLMENMTDIVMEVDAQGNYCYVSPNYASLTGYMLEEELQGSAFKHVHPDDLPVLLQKAEEIFVSQRQVSATYRVQHKRGEWRWLETSAKSYLAEDGTPRIISVARDVTERKLNDEKLRESEKRMQLAASAGWVGLWDWDIAKDELIWDESMYTLYGLQKGDFHGVYQAWTSTLHPDDRQFVDGEIQSAVRGERPYTPEFRIIRPDGTIRVIKATSQTLYDSQGKALRMLGTNVDITEQKLTEEKLHTAREFLKGVQNSLSAHIAILDHHGVIVDVNNAWRKFGDENGLQSLTYCIGDNYLDFCDVSAMQPDRMVGQSIRAVLSGEQESAQIEYPCHSPTEMRWFDLRITKFQNGEHLWVVLAHENITKRKLAEENLRQSENRFVTIFENSPIVVSISRLSDSRFTDVNSAFVDLVGYSREEILGRTAIEMGFWSRPDNRVDLISRLLADGRVRNYETQIRGKTGDEIHVLMSAEIVEIDGEQCSVLQAVDITERKQNELAILQKTEDLLLINLLNEAVNRGESFEKLTQLLSFEVQRIFDCRTASIYLLASDQQLVLQHLSTPAPLREQIEKMIGQPIPEIDLNLQDAEYFQAVLQSEQGIIIYDPDRIKKWMLTFLAAPSLPDAIRQSIRKLVPRLTSLIEIKSVMTIPLKSGRTTLGLLELTASHLFTEQDLARLQNVRGQFTEILLRMKVEESLRQSEAQYRNLAQELEQRVQERTAELRDLYDNAPNGYHSLDKNGNYALVNQTELDWLGYQRAELIGKNFGDLLTPSGRERFAEDFSAFKKVGRIVDMQIEIIRKDGNVLPILANAVAVYDSQGNFLQSRSILLDLTEHQKIERALRESDEQNRILFEESPDPTALLDASGTFLRINHAYEDLTGYTRAALIGKQGQDFGLVTPETQVELTQKVLASRAQNEPFAAIDYILHRSDGQLRHVETRIFMLMLANQTRILYTVRDVTQRKQAEDALRESRASLQYFFDTASDLIQSLDENGHFRYVNRAWCQTLGYTVDDALQLNMLDVIDPGDRAHCSSLLKLLISTQQPQQLEVTFRTKDGEALIMEGSVTSWKDHSEHVVTNGIFRNITERKKAQEVLRKSRDQLSAANAALEKAARMKDEFLASMSHELRTPLTGILGLSEALQMKTYGSLSEKQLTALNNIELSGRHLLALINDILDLSKIEAGKLDLRFETFALADACQASLQLTKGLAHQKNQKVSVSIDSAADVVYADPRRLKQMLVNLLSNAIKFTPKDGSLGLVVESSAAEQVIRLTVWDHGMGIKPEDMPRLFQAFVQLDSGLARQSEGTGLGLALVQRMAELHGGSLQVESTLGQGSRFTIILPWSPSSVGSLHQPFRQTNPLEQSLTVEDNDLDAEHLARYLQTLGLKNTVTPLGFGAVELAAALKPDVILLDLHLPDKSGIEVLVELKADRRTQTIPVLITSVEEKRAETLALGAVGYLVKPFVLEELRAELTRIVTDSENLASVMVIAAQPNIPLILIVDDNEVTLKMLADVLETKSLRVAMARSGPEMLKLVSEIRPNLILMDIQMPGMDGLEATRRVRAHADPGLAAIPIIALTALAMTGDRERCLEAGASDYISKPVQLPNLVARIFELLAKRG